MKLINTITTHLDDYVGVTLGDAMCHVDVGNVVEGMHIYSHAVHLNQEELKSLISVLQTAQYMMEQGRKNV